MYQTNRGISRRAVIGLPVALAFGRVSWAQDFTVTGTGAEKAARGYLGSLIGSEAEWASFWDYDRAFNLELGKLTQADPKSIESLKRKWTANITEDRHSKSCLLYTSRCV